MANETKLMKMTPEQVKTHYNLLKTRYEEQKALLDQLEELINHERADRKKTEEDAIDLMKSVKHKYEEQIRDVKTNGDREIKLLQAMLEEGKNKIENHAGDIRHQLDAVRTKLSQCQDKVRKLEKDKKKTVEELDREKALWEESLAQTKFELDEKLILLEEAKKSADQYMSNYKCAQEEQSKLNRKLEDLTNRLSDTEAARDAFKLQISDLKTKADTKGDDMSSKVEMRTLQRELDAEKDKVKYARDINIKIRQEKRELEERMDEIQKALRAKDKEIDKLTAKRRESDSNFQKMESDYQDKVKDLQGRINVLEEKCKEAKDAENKISEWKTMCEREQKENRKLLDNVADLERKCSRLSGEIRNLKTEADSKDALVKKLEENNRALRTIGSDQDVQLNQLEERCIKLLKEVKTGNSERIELSKTNNQLANDLRNLRRELDDQNKLVDELKSKLDSEKDLAEYRVGDEKAKVRNMEEEVRVESQNARDALEQVEALEHELRVKSSELDSASEQFMIMEDELYRIKEEAAKTITTAQTLQSDKCKLSLALEEALRKNDQLEGRMHAILDEVEVRQGIEKERTIKLEDQISQHVKLVDFLQKKVEELENKKKPLIGFNTPTPSTRSYTPSTPQVSSNQAAHQAAVADLEREKKTSRRLQQKLEDAEIKLHKTEAELFDLKMENKLMKANVIDNQPSARNQGSDPTAPPPYADDGSLSTSGDSSHTTDSNTDHGDQIDAVSFSDDSYRRAVRKETLYAVRKETVYADIHGQTSSAQSSPEGEFTFTDSVLEEIGAPSK
ncbi:hypothetical protein HDE_04150 [Halotydeus destructor]|nr:hypothetical protein HDE_04150 [Halotydeus destructor]